MPQNNRYNKRYTAQEVEFIKSNFDKLSVAEISTTLKRTPKAIRGQIERMGLPLCSLERNAPYPWSDSEIDFIKNNYLTMSDLKMSKKLGISKSIVCRKRLELDLRVHHGNKYFEDGYYKQYINGKKVFVHRHVAETKLGRKLRPTERVHHVNGDKLNNDPNNLYVCTNRSVHGKIHDNLENIAFKLVEKGVIKFNHETGEYYL